MDVETQIALWVIASIAALVAYSFFRLRSLSRRAKGLVAARIANAEQFSEPSRMADPHDKPTHILQTFKSQKASMLFRVEDGILVAMHQNSVVVYGDNPKDKNSYTFIDEPAAAKWLRDVYPAKDMTKQGLEGQAPVLEERDGEAHGLYTPEGSLELPGFGPYNQPRKFN